MSIRSRVLQITALLASSLVSTSSLGVTPPRIHNHAAAFIAYWKKHQGDAAEKQIQAFKAEVVPTFPAFYQMKFEKWKAQGKNPDAMIAEQLKDFPAIEAKFIQTNNELSQQINQNLKTFLATFPDMDTNFDIYVVHSLGEMDGGTRKIVGDLNLVFGVDGIVRYHQNSQTTVPFFHHELFHIYHAQHFSGPDVVWPSLWMEGLATYVSDALNPGSSPADIMLETPPGLVAACKKDLPGLVTMMRARLESDSEKDYERFFLLASTDPTVPKRAGYYLGYLIAKEMGRTRSLQELANLQGDTLLKEIRSALDTLQH